MLSPPAQKRKRGKVRRKHLSYSTEGGVQTDNGGQYSEHDQKKSERKNSLNVKEERERRAFAMFYAAVEDASNEKVRGKHYLHERSEVPPHNVPRRSVGTYRQR